MEKANKQKCTNQPQLCTPDQHFNNTGSLESVPKSHPEFYVPDEIILKFNQASQKRHLKINALLAAFYSNDITPVSGV